MRAPIGPSMFACMVSLFLMTAPHSAHTLRDSPLFFNQEGYGALLPIPARRTRQLMSASPDVCLHD
jgi:hypothetical protein